MAASGAATRRRSTTNNFDGLRLIAALLVMVSHQFVFLHQAEPTPLGDSIGQVAVMMFFVVSGFLVCESWHHDPHVVRFAMRRLLRIWPALAVATLAIALYGALLSSIPPGTYFGHDLLRFVKFNLQVRPIYRLPGVFDSTPPNAALSAVNGSWWSIPLEIRCYGYLACLGLIGLRRRWVSMIALALSGLMYVRTSPGHALADDFSHLSYFYVSLFLGGVCARQFMIELQANARLTASLLVLMVLGALGLHWWRLVEWLVMAPSTLWLGVRSTLGLRSAGKFGDLSYGIYLYAYLIQQVVVRAWPTQSYLPTLLIAMLVSAFLAWLSWHVVEKPSLALKSRLRDWFPDGAV